MQRAIALGLGIVIGLGIGVAVADRADPVIVSKVDVATPEVAPGGELRLKLHIYRIRNDCTYVERRTFLGSDLVKRENELEVQRQGQPLGSSIEDRVVHIPLTLPQGTVEFTAESAFTCGSNWLQYWWPTKIRTPPLYFDVEGPPVVSPEG